MRQYEQRGKTRDMILEDPGARRECLIEEYARPADALPADPEEVAALLTGPCRLIRLWGEDLAGLERKMARRPGLRERRWQGMMRVIGPADMDLDTVEQVHDLVKEYLGETPKSFAMDLWDGPDLSLELVLKPV